MEKFTKQNLFLAGLAFLLLFIALFTNLNLSPLHLEEPRRALVALEMLLNDNLIVPTVSGEFYYNKPPLFNWAIIACYKLFGNYSEAAVRFPSTFSFLLLGIIIFLTGKEYVCLSFGVYSSLLFLTSAEILFYFSLLGEIDLFYALITFGSFITLYSFYQSRHYYFLFISTYFLGALGTLTKGFPSLVFLGISILVFFLYNKNFKKLFTLPHFSGIILYVMIVAGYFWMYSHYNDAGRFIQNLWGESMQRTVVGEEHKISLVKHIFLFPLNMLESTFPASLLLIFALKKNFLKKVRENRFVEFSCFMFISNILIYWISPGTRSRYVYMLFPFIIMILTYFYVQYACIDHKKLRIFHTLTGIFITILTITFFSLPVISDLEEVRNLLLLSIISGMLGTVLFILFVIMKRNRLLLFILSVILLRFVFNFSILPIRATNSKHQIQKNIAYKIVEITQNEPLYIFNKSHFSNTAAFYVERERGKILTRKDTLNNNDFFIVDKSLLENKHYKVFYTFYVKNTEFLLIKLVGKGIPDLVNGV